MEEFVRVIMIKFENQRRCYKLLEAYTFLRTKLMYNINDGPEHKIDTCKRLYMGLFNNYRNDCRIIDWCSILRPLKQGNARFQY